MSLSIMCANGRLNGSISLMPARQIGFTPEQFCIADDEAAPRHHALDLQLSPFVIGDARDEKMLLTIRWRDGSPFRL